MRRHRPTSPPRALRFLVPSVRIADAVQEDVHHERNLLVVQLDPLVRKGDVLEEHIAGQKGESPRGR